MAVWWDFSLVFWRDGTLADSKAVIVASMTVLKTVLQSVGNWEFEYQSTKGVLTG